MPRRIIANFYMTLDGYGEFPDYPGSDFVPPEPDEMWKLLWSGLYDSVDTVIFGRRAYEGHLRVHTEAARKPGDPPYMFDYSRWLDRAKKVVLSRTLTQATWPNTRLLSGPLEDVVAQLKSEPGKDIIVDGGPALVSDFVKQGLVDDYRMAVWPVIHGRGFAYWQKMETQQTLRLLSVQTLRYGELVLHYEAVR